jgi:tetratricopeptide (TPR) repeat protein
LGDVGALVLLNYRYAVAAMLAGEPASALRELVAETRRLSETSNDPGVRLVGTYATSLSTLAATLAETLEAYDSAWAICAGDPRIGQDLLGEMLYHRILWGRAQALAYMGRFEQARQDVQRLLKLAAEVGATEPDVAVLAQGMAVQVGYVAQDAPEPMLMLAREMVGFAQRSGAAVMMVYAYSVLGMANLSCQRWDDAIDAVEQSLAVQNTTRTALVFQAYAVTTLASAHSARGEFALAREAADRAVELAVRFGIKRIEARARITRAAVLIASGDPGARAAAREDLDAADGLRREIGARVFEPMIRVHEAELAKLNGDETGRRALLKKARELFTEMQMTGWLKQLDAMT